MYFFFQPDTGQQTGLELARSTPGDDKPSLAQRLYRRCVGLATRLAYQLTSGDSFSTLIILVAWALIVSLFLHRCSAKKQSSKRREKNQIHEFMRKVERDDGRSSPNNDNNSDQSGLKIIELKAETYNGMVRLSKPGYRSIVVLVDQETKQILMNKFKTAVWPYRRNKPLLFGYLCLDKNLDWYKTLLESILSCENLNVNKKNCIGTVLSLNGFNKYLRIYHVKHHEKTDHEGAFPSFDNDMDDDDDHHKYNDDYDDLEHGCEMVVQSSVSVGYDVDSLLETFPAWLEKVFDGATRRYYLDDWPEEIN